MGRRSSYEDKKHLLLAHINKVTMHTAAPTVRELADLTQVGVATIHSYLGKMAEEGLIKWQPKSHRSLQLTDKGREHLRPLPGVSPF